MYFQVTCSNCGHRGQKLPYDGHKTPERIVNAGWRNFGSAWYCPKCANTWAQRNGPNRPLCGPDDGKIALLIQMVDELVGVVNRLEQERKTGDEYDW